MNAFYLLASWFSLDMFTWNHQQMILYAFYVTWHRRAFTGKEQLLNNLYRWLVKNRAIAGQAMWLWAWRCCPEKKIFHVPLLDLLTGHCILGKITSKFPHRLGICQKNVRPSTEAGAALQERLVSNTPRTLKTFILHALSVLDRLLGLADSSVTLTAPASWFQRMFSFKGVQKSSVAC